MTNPAVGRGLGLLDVDANAPQPEGKRDWEFDLLGLPLAATSEASVEDCVLTVLDQGSTNSCVANAWEQAVRIEKARLGYEAELGSRLFGYSNSRAAHDADHTDIGTYLRTYAAGLKKLGNCNESVWPFDPLFVNRTPPATAFAQAWGRRGIKGYYKIYSTGAARSLAIRAALAQRRPVVFGTSVDTEFTQSWGSTLIDIPKGLLIGGHAMCIVGFDRHGPGGEFRYRIVNSWGRGWRDNGFAWFTEEFIQWYALQDLWVVSLL